MVATDERERGLTPAQRDALTAVRSSHGAHVRWGRSDFGHQERVLDVLVARGLAEWDPSERGRSRAVTPAVASGIRDAMRQESARLAHLTALGMVAHAALPAGFRVHEECGCVVQESLADAHVRSVHPAAPQAPSGDEPGCSCSPDPDTGDLHDEDGWPCSHG